MTYTIQSKPFNGDRWMFREQCYGQADTIMRLGTIMKNDARLKMLRESEYRIMCGEEVLLTFPFLADV
jgi:hypothetical protein